jgi:hypothetical protein
VTCRSCLVAFDTAFSREYVRTEYEKRNGETVVHWSRHQFCDEILD